MSTLADVPQLCLNNKISANQNHLKIDWMKWLYQAGARDSTEIRLNCSVKQVFENMTVPPNLTTSSSLHVVAAIDVQRSRQVSRCATGFHRWTPVSTSGRRLLQWLEQEVGSWQPGCSQRVLKTTNFMKDLSDRQKHMHTSKWNCGVHAHTHGLNSSRLNKLHWAFHIKFHLKNTLKQIKLHTLPLSFYFTPSICLWIADRTLAGIYSL